MITVTARPDVYREFADLADTALEETYWRCGRGRVAAR